MRGERFFFFCPLQQWVLRHKLLNSPQMPSHSLTLKARKICQGVTLQFPGWKGNLKLRAGDQKPVFSCHLAPL